MPSSLKEQLEAVWNAPRLASSHNLVAWRVGAVNHQDGWRCYKLSLSMSSWKVYFRRAKLNGVHKNGNQGRL